ncbi:MAG: O-antigen ligase family protein [Chloroflexi bacterium]|nr:O-antigen ligase family protein [Chloroflexota bacterium]MCI0576639.1 O-antigen ligase family protein [Chloroflexota bacterium]MCI0646993.1 O-antigen ligase family protein [Chloroflexota bacterium]MCI0730693.1 O-antigen ligase family protein [Chloroflexota bacterium]
MKALSLRRFGLFSLALLAFSLPFELETPWLVLGPFRLTNLEVVLGVAAALAMALVLKEQRWRQSGWLVWPATWLGLLALVTVVAFLSAGQAGDLQLNALKAAVRSLSGLALALAVPQLVRHRSEMAVVLVALLAGGLLSVMSGLAEVWLGTTIAWLDLFRGTPTAAGPFIRLSGTFNHANQTAMFMEATAPLFTAAAWTAWQRGYRLLAGMTMGAGLLYLQAVFLTYSRSGFVTIFLASLIIAGLLLWRPASERRQARPWLGLAGVILFLFVVNTWLSPVLRLRLVTEGDDEWYQVRFEVPERLTMTASEIQMVTIRVENQGSLLWSEEGENPIRLGAHWYRPADNKRSSDDLHWTLDRDVYPGESIVMTVPVVPPSIPGTYELEWDMVQEEVVWFSVKNGLYVATDVVVQPNEGQTTPAVDTFTDNRALVAPIPGRGALWLAAARQFLQRPLLGIGLDNFRMSYGKWLGYEVWNTSIHTNNWYVETLVSLGLLGSLPFFAWLALVGLDIVKSVRGGERRIGRDNGRAGVRWQPASVWSLALAAGLLAYFIHGLLDYFLLFNGTGLLFWLLSGLWVARRGWRGRRPGQQPAGMAIQAAATAPVVTLPRED